MNTTHTIKKHTGKDKPTKVGVYERQNPHTNNKSYSKWNGEFWCSYWSVKEFASKDNMKSSEQNWDWYEEISFERAKFRTPDPEISTEVQKKLFEMGYKWSSGDKDIRHFKYMFIDEEGKITGCETESFFQDSKSNWGSRPEMIVEVEKTIKVSFKEKPVETVEFNGKKYDKKKLEEALKAIEQL